MTEYQYTWEEAVLWLRGQPEQAELTRACYFDDPLIDAAERFYQSAEWQETRKLLPNPPGEAIDLGAGRGISSYALARDGWRVTAVEPDPSPIVGAGAIRELAAQAKLPITVVEMRGEALPAADGAFDVALARQALHHARNLDSFAAEAARVLKPGGTFLATREHVVDRREEMKTFLDSHPLHRLYGGENAFRLDQYRSAILSAGLRLTAEFGPLDTVINFFPATRESMKENIYQRVRLKLGRPGRLMAQLADKLSNDALFRLAIAYLSKNDKSPGRMYTFRAQKPGPSAGR